MGRVGLAGEWDYLASLYVINDAVSAKTWSRLETTLARVLDAHAGAILGGVSTRCCGWRCREAACQNRS
jgi:hypothetical protein